MKALGAHAVDTVTRSRGIVVYAISPIQGLALNNGQDAKNIVGFCSEKVHLLNGQANDQLRSHLVFDRDLGVDIVTKNGIAFDLNNYKNAANKQQFIKVATKAIAEQVAKTEYKAKCTCQLYKGLFAEESCHVESVNKSSAVS